MWALYKDEFAVQANASKKTYDAMLYCGSRLMQLEKSIGGKGISLSSVARENGYDYRTVEKDVKQLRKDFLTGAKDSKNFAKEVEDAYATG